MNSIKSILGANIKFYRKKIQLSQEQLAEKLDITTKHLSTIETGATFVSVELLEKLTLYLSVSASALFYSVDEVSFDESLISKVDRIIDNENQKAANAMKLQIRYLQNQKNP
jgi:transcriptional regulator with XRE-family HTH domain